MDEMQRPIGVFDSGVGGISVLRELVALMPNENFIFYGDSKNAPYGTKTLEEVRKLTLADAEYLRSRNVKALVVACNTATSAAIHILREKYQKEIPVIGIEPALKPAVSVKENSRVLVMATPMTLREKKFHNLMQKFQDQAEIISLPCPGLVEFVERGELSGEALEHFLKNLFAPYQKRKVDAVLQLRGHLADDAAGRDGHRAVRLPRGNIKAAISAAKWDVCPAKDAKNRQTTGQMRFAVSGYKTGNRRPSFCIPWGIFGRTGVFAWQGITSSRAGGR